MAIETKRIGHDKIGDNIYHSYLTLTGEDHWCFLYKNNMLLKVRKNHAEVPSNTAPDDIKASINKFKQNNPYNR